MPFLPLQGTPQVFDPRNPTLLPNFDTQVAAQGASFSGAAIAAQPSVMQAESAAQYNGQAGVGQTRVNASSQTITIGGTWATNDTATITVACGTLSGPLGGAPNGTGSLAFQYTAVAGDTAVSVAEGLVNLINASITASGVGLIAELDVGGGANTAVITLLWPGVIGNLATFTTAKSSASGTVAPASGTFSGGSGPVYAANNIEYWTGTNMAVLWYGRPYALPINLITSMVQQGIAIV